MSSEALIRGLPLLQGFSAATTQRVLLALLIKHQSKDGNRVAVTQGELVRLFGLGDKKSISRSLKVLRTGEFGKVRPVIVMDGLNIILTFDPKDGFATGFEAGGGGGMVPPGEGARRPPTGGKAPPHINKEDKKKREKALPHTTPSQPQGDAPERRLALRLISLTNGEARPISARLENWIQKKRMSNGSTDWDGCPQELLEFHCSLLGLRKKEL